MHHCHWRAGVKRDIEDLDLQFEMVKIEMNREEESVQMITKNNLLVHVVNPVF